MKQLDLFYYAYEKYKEEFVGNRDNYLFKKGVNSKKAPNDQMSMISVICDIEEDWIMAIEKGLEYIAKAIKEDRQFIRNEGDVLPIEKIRRVSKDSITDLSKHSNYITKLPEEGKDVVPEKLLMIQRENDYTIYENRVVYTTLMYLKDFVAERLEKIKDLINKYDGKVLIKKKIDLGYRTVDVVLDIHDVRKNDELAIERAKCKDKIERLDQILNGVLILLKTPLMQAVSKAPLVTRPVTKTNVLKMNTNFKETLAIFDYVCAYNKPGYTITETENVIAPLSIEQEDAFSDVILLSSFLTYEYNNHLEDRLHKEYLLEVKRRKEIEEQKVLDRIKELMDKASKSGKDLGEYLLMLEEGYKILESRVEELKQKLETVVAEYEQKIVDLNIKHEEEMQELAQKHYEEILEINNQHQIELQEQAAKHEEDMANLRASLEQEYGAIIEEKNKCIEEKNTEISAKNEEIATQQVKIGELNELVVSKDLEITQTKEQCEKEITLAHAENLALRAEKGQPKVNPRDFTTKERFDELENEMNVLKEFFDKSWQATKKEIKKAHYSQIKPKGKKK